MAEATVPAGNEAKLREYLRRVAGDLEEKNRQLGELRARSREPIAIVGMSCRYPGGVDSPEGLWRLVAERTDAAGPIPADRGWDPEALYDPDPDHPGTSYTREGGFITDAGDFDADFFGISHREAVAMDPQQRLLLEACWESLEHAGIDPARLHGEDAGVFVGAIQYRYGAGSAIPAELEGYLGTGTTASVISGRVAYSLGLVGPAVTVDTACSSSLVAMHQAVASLRGGECSLALAGGVTVISAPGVFTEFSRQRVLAPDGRSKAFAAAADGVGWSEGIGVLVLERLADAQAAGHEVLATIRGSAVNQDGASNGLTAPHGPSQERVIRQALANAHLIPAEVDAVEAHGTGTPLGDPIEAGALLATYGADRGDRGPLLLGSIKSNIGHAQAAAGVAGVIKMVEAFRHEELPATIHVDAPTPHVDWDAGAVELLTEPREWKRDGRPRRAAVSSFGISGTNAHLILEEAPAPTTTPTPGEEGEQERAPIESGPLPFLLSGKSEPALREAAAKLASHLRARPDLDLADLAWSLATSRAAFEHRAVALAEDREELLSELDALAAAVPTSGIVSGRTRGRGKVAFVFPGQGTEWREMARELLRSSPVFAASLAECDAALAPYLDWSLRALLGDGEGPDLGRIEVVQPALFAVMVSLARLWRSFGVEPAAVVGHSQGEIAASYVAGALSLEDAASLVSLRSQALADQLIGKGAVVSLALSAERAARAIEPFGDLVSLAAINGPASTVVSGDPGALEELLATWESEGVRAKRIPIDFAAHSAQIEALRGRLDEELVGLAPRAGEIPLYSTVVAEPLAGETLDAGYWFRNLREPVHFEGATRALLADSFNAFVEISPQPALTMAVVESVDVDGADPDSIAAFGTLRRDEGGPARFLAALAEAHVNGIEVDWTRLFRGSPRRRVELPTYPFQRERFWLASGSGAGDVAAAGLGATEHPLLGAEVAVAEGDGRLFTGRISIEAHPWLADHAVFGTVILPGTALLELALHAGTRAGLGTVEELVMQAPLVLPPEGAVQIQVSLGGADDDGRRPVAIHSRPDVGPGEHEEEEAWVLHASGRLADAEANVESVAGDVWPPEGAEAIGVDGLYDGLAAAGFEYGPAFQGLTAAWRRGNEVFAEVSLPEDDRGAEGSFAIHPALFDAALHAVGAALLDGDGDQESLGAGLPFAWNGVSIQRPDTGALRVRISSAEGGDGDGPAAVALALADQSGAPIGSVRSLVTRPVSRAGQLGGAHQQSLFRLEWIGFEASAAPASEPVRLDTAGLGGDDDLPAAAHSALHEALALIQEFLADERRADSQLVVLTHGAVATGPDEAPVDLASASIWGLVRSAQAEHPGRLLLVDIDDDPASTARLDGALAAAASLGESQLALRGGEARVPRLARAAAGAAADGPRLIDPDGTVLITGGTGALGGLLARHLVAEHGVAHLVLASRSGPAAEGAAELGAELEGLGAEVAIAACDVRDRGQLAATIDAIPAAHPLRAVIHAAGAMDDGTIETLDPERLDLTLSPKADAAWYLHELTAGADLEAFVTFSSAAGTLGSPGQGNYAAANAFLDALCARRQAEGLPGTSLAWGYWEERGGLTGDLGEEDLERLRRAGIGALSSAEGLALFDAAYGAEDPLMLPIRLEVAYLRAAARAGMVPPLLSGLVGGASRRATGDGSLARALAEAPEDERDKLVVDLVRAHVAVVVGQSSGAAIDPTRAFKDLGFDSLAAVELRNRLTGATGLRLKPTLVFDHPTPARVAAVLREQAENSAAGVRVSAPRPARTEEPIAIVGMSCRYPGGVSSPEELWRLLDSGTDAVAGFPQDRGWDIERLHSPELSQPGTSYVTEGAFLREAGEFDAAFFGIAPREALAMDPQQRLLLEGAWEAFEDAGIDPVALRGSQSGVFAGVINGNYGLESVRSRVDLEGYVGIGNTASVASGRVAYTFGLEGPAVSVDTACSSSLVAIHLACQALRQGECSLALAGGVTVIAEPGVIVELSRQRVLAPDGRCKAFGARADGMGTSEGMGLVLLEPLSTARRNGHDVLAVIRGSAVNQDGASNGLTAPNGPAQERVIERALANAGLSAAEVDAVEAHGTGTPLGDPIEAGALLATYGRGRGDSRPLRLGTLKSNIGHTQAAAGVAGVIKMVQAMRHGALPRTLHADPPSEHIEWDAGEVELLTEEMAWEANGRPRRAGVSSFGISGTNAHLILEEATEPESAIVESPDFEAPASPLSGVLALPLSARSGDALRQMAVDLVGRLREDPSLDPADVSFSLAAGRARFAHRAIVTGADREELLAGLEETAQGVGAESIVRATGAPVFVFSGQGSQWPGMARDLLEGSPVFAASIKECERALAPFVDWSLPAVIADEGEAWLERLDVVQPALFAVMVSLARLWEACGVRPAAVVGHSQGEIVAAHVAGALTLEDAARVVALRSRAMVQIAGRGGMLSLGLGAEEARARLAHFEGRLSLAAVNGPGSVVVSGEPAALAELARACEDDGVRTREVAVDYAAHSAQVDALRDELLEDFASVEPRASATPFFSTVTGEELVGTALDAAYWYRNLRETVLLEPAVRALLGRGERRFLEIGPHPVLALGLQEVVKDEEDARVLDTLRRGEGGPRRFLSSVAAAELAGIDIDWAALVPAGSRVTLPTYPFRRERFWLVPGEANDPAAVGQAAVDHPFVGALAELPADEGLLLTGRLSLDDHPWLADHAVLGTAILPGTALLELALQAGEKVGAPVVRELTLQAPVALPEDERLALSVRVGPAAEDGSRPVTIASRSEDEGTGWIVNAAGTLDPAGVVAADEPLAWSAADAEPVAIDGLYDRLAEAGLDYGPEFRRVTAAWRRAEEVFVEVELDPDLRDADGGFLVHPAVLDAAFHPLFGVLDLGQEGLGAPRLPFSFSGVRRGPGDAGSLRVRVAKGSKAGEVTLEAFDQSEGLVLRIDSLLTRPVDPDAFAGRATGGPTYSLDWREIAVTPAGPEPPEVAVLELPAGGEDAAAAHASTAKLLAELQAFLADEERADERLVVLTRGALAVQIGETPDPAAAAALGLFASAASEHPGRFAAIDLDEASAGALPGLLALTQTEPRFALREGRVLVPRLRPTSAGPDGEASEVRHLGTRRRGTLEDLAWLPSTAADRPLAPGQVRISVRAAGLNVRDVLIALDIYPEEAPIGSEAAGVVAELGPGVEDLAVGDPVMGTMADAISPVAVAAAEDLTRLPSGWAFAEGASVPVAFATAWYGLHDRARLSKGESVLIHAGAGSLGMAAIQIAKLVGARVFATASEWKWPALIELGVPRENLAGSEDLDFVERVREATKGRGVDVVLNSLAGKFVDASAALLADGGRFLEIGKTDIRDPADLPRGIDYIPFDPTEAGGGRSGEILAEIYSLAEAGKIQAPPIEHADLGRPGEAFRHLREGRDVGKVVFDLGAPPDPDRTVLITGAPGGLGSLVARHLAAAGTRRLVLASRRGPEAEGAAELREEIADLGGQVEFVACDVADREAVDSLIAGIDADHPLGTVIHAAGMLEDATVANLDPEHLRRVFAPKVDGAWNLHEATAGIELEGFVLFSSLAGLLGGPGQGNYAAANCYLDAFAQRRRAEGLPATSIAWGMWEAGMVEGLTEAQRERVVRSGLAPITAEEGLAILDRARASSAALLVVAPTEAAALRRLASAELLPPLFADLVRSPRRSAAVPRGDLAARLAAVPEAGREAVVLTLVAEHVAAVLGHASVDEIDPDRAFQDLGFDSLAAVELRNRLVAATGLRLAPTLVFDHPTARQAALHLLAECTAGAESSKDLTLWQAFDKLKAMLDLVAPEEDAVRAAARERLVSYLHEIETPAAESGPAALVADRVGSMSADELLDLIDGMHE